MTNTNSEFDNYLRERRNRDYSIEPKGLVRVGRLMSYTTPNPHVTLLREDGSFSRKLINLRDLEQVDRVLGHFLMQKMGAIEIERLKKL